MGDQTPSGRLLVHAEECRGCRSCQLACSFAKTGEYNPSMSFVRLHRDMALEKTSPLILPLRCDFCGGDPACARACTYGAIVFDPSAHQRSIEYLQGGPRESD